MSKKDEMAAQKAVQDAQIAQDAKDARNLKVAVLVDAINAKTVTDEQYIEMKEVVGALMLRLLAGGTFTGNENTINGYVAKMLNRATTNGKADAAKKAKKALTDATYEADLQKYTVDVRALLVNFGAKVIPETEINELADVKTMFAAFIKTLPAMPKKAGAGNATGGNGVWNKLVDVAKMKSGSTLHVLYHTVKNATDGMTRVQMEDCMIEKFPTRTEVNNKFSVYEAISGRLPLVKVVVDGFDDSWIVETVVEPEVETEK